MKNIFETDTENEVLQRLNKLQPKTQNLWGKMNVAQMMAHCSAALEVAVGKKFPSRMFIGRILSPFIKSILTNEKPFQKNTPTDRTFVYTDQRNFDQEKVKLQNIIKEFAEGGKDKCTTHPHSFFGKLTPNEWGVGMYKHLDHHLRQFGV